MRKIYCLAFFLLLTVAGLHLKANNVAYVNHAFGNKIEGVNVVQMLDVDHTDSTQMSVCDSVVWRGRILTQSGMYRDTVEDETTHEVTEYVLVLTVRHSSGSVFQAVGCDSYEWHGVTYTESTLEPTFVETNSVGCDSVIALHLMLYHSSYATDEITACDSLVWNGNTYYESTDTPRYYDLNEV